MLSTPPPQIPLHTTMLGHITSARSFLSLPTKILLLIVRNTLRHDLNNLLLASKRMSNLGSEELYRDVSFTHSGIDKKRMTKLVCTLTQHPDLAKLIQSISYTEDISNECTICHKSDPGTGSEFGNGRMTREMIQVVIDNAISANLPYGWGFPGRHKHVSNTPGHTLTNEWIQDIRRSSLEAILAVLLSILPNLSKMTLHFHECVNPIWTSGLAQAAVLAPRNSSAFMPTEVNQPPLRQMFSRLKNIDIIGRQIPDHDLSDSPWMSLPSVKRVQRSGYTRDLYEISCLVPNLAVNLSGVCTLRIQRSKNPMSRLFGKALTTCNSLRSLHIRQSGKLSQRFVQSLKTLNHSLQDLVIDGRASNGDVIHEHQRTVGCLVKFYQLQNLEISTEMICGHVFSELELLPELIPRSIEVLILTDFWVGQDHKKAGGHVHELLHGIRAGKFPLFRSFTICFPPNEPTLLVEDIQELNFASIMEQKFKLAFEEANIQFQVLQDTDGYRK